MPATLTILAIKTTWTNDEQAAAALSNAAKLLSGFVDGAPVPPVPAIEQQVAAPARLEAQAAPADAPSDAPAKPVRLGKKRGRPRKPREETTREERPADPPVAAKPPKPPTPDEQKSLADRMANHIETRGPLSTSRLAQLLATSENSIKRAVGHAKNRFWMDEDENWHVREAA